MMRVMLLALLLLLPGLRVLAIEYSGEQTIYTDTVWQGEVLIDGILTIASGATLEIRPGTRIRFVKIDINSDGIGESEIFVQGRFIARGTAEQPIIFTSAQKNPAPGDWGALNMMMGEEDESLLEHCLVEYAYRGFHAHFARARLKSSVFRNNQRGAQFQEATVVIEDSEFSDNFNGLQFRDSKVEIRNSRILNNFWGIRAVFVELQMQGTQVTGNRTNGINLRDSSLSLHGNRVDDNRRGIYLQRSRGELSGNSIVGNLEHGIYLEESVAEVQGNLLRSNGRSALKILDSDGLIENNRIENSGEFSLFNAGVEDFSVGGNWYGGATHPPELMDGSSRAGLGMLKLAPPLNQQPEVKAF